MNKSAILCALLAGLGLSGCASKYADVPTPTRFEAAAQKKLQAAHHWQVIAGHVAEQLAADLSMGDKLAGRALYVPQPGGEQAFVEGFRELLITALVERGVPVATQAQGALSVDVRYAAYRFSPDRVVNQYRYGELTSLAVGLWGLGAIGSAKVTQAVGVRAGSVLIGMSAWLDGFGWLENEATGKSREASGPVPQSEIVLTTSIADAGRIVARKSHVYFVADADVGLYWNRPAAGGTVLQVSGDCGGEVAKCVR